MTLPVEFRSPDTDTLETLGGEAVILGLGSILLGFQIAYIRTSDEGLWHLLYEFILPMFVTVGLLVGGTWLLTTDYAGRYFLRVGFWCLAGLNVMLLGSAFTLAALQTGTHSLHEPLLIMFDYVTGGAAAGFVLGIYDSNRREKAAQLEETNEQMSWLNQQLSVLNRVLRHDIRNDANVILGYADRIETQYPDASDHTQIIQERASNLVELGNKARDIEHLLNREAWSRESIDVVPILERQAAELTQEYPSLAVDLDVPESQYVLALPMLAAAIEEALTNAVEHNDASRPRVEVRVETCTRDGAEWVDIRIADNGPGLPDEELAVLERECETDLQHASGLGLWVIKWATKASGGEVTFQRTQPRGTVVTLRLEKDT